MFNNNSNFTNFVSNIIENGAISIANKTITYAEWCINKYDMYLDCMVTTLIRKPLINIASSKMSFICQNRDIGKLLSDVEPQNIIRSVIQVTEYETMPECTNQDILMVNNFITSKVRTYLTPVGNVSYLTNICKIPKCDLTRAKKFLLSMGYEYTTNISSIKFSDITGSPSVEVVDDTDSSAEEDSSIFPAWIPTTALGLGVLGVSAAVIIYRCVCKKNSPDASISAKNSDAVEKQQSIDNDNNHMYEHIPFNHTGECKSITPDTQTSETSKMLVGDQNLAIE
ncbi:Uncharacterised protein [Orientia tsutsugamushi]|uniref:Uncharacterized protein n=1 Tax=Orientia tsutsugamushi TaxID=784 RepID=A0A2U3R3X1_ORITS|nr:hypothetical protein [Orientia tsutsugamushi]KJV77054.1 hypothetical protein OTSUT76_2378 [Orientia tsutsugamushi str. UT76]SPR07911.1 Uncharacterised protein [Orientia tsutsugamushi]